MLKLDIKEREIFYEITSKEIRFSEVYCECQQLMRLYEIIVSTLDNSSPS